MTGTVPQGARRLARVSLASLGLNVTNTVLAVITTAVLAQLMGASEFGIYAFVVATITVLGVPAILGFDRLLVREIAVHIRLGAEGLAAGLLQRSVQVSLALALVIAVVACVVAWFVPSGRADAPFVAFVIGAAGLPFLVLGQVVQGGLMGLHRVVLGQAPESLLRPLLLLGGVLLAAGVMSRIDAPLAVTLYAVTLALAALAAFGLLRRSTPREVRTADKRFDDRAWLVGATVLAFLSGTVIINAQIGVVLLGTMADSGSAGLFAVAQRGAMLVAFPLAAVNSAIAPTAARLWAAGERGELQRLVTLSARGALLAALPVAGAFVFFGGPILRLVFGADFSAADVSLAVVSLGQMANVATGSVGVLLVMTGHQREAALGTAAGAGLNVLLTIALIPPLGALGAAAAAAASNVVSNGLLVIAVRRKLRLDSTAAGLIPAALG
jgi:O-antigen/teichoic acid export membrane protein